MSRPTFLPFLYLLLVDSPGNLEMIPRDEMCPLSNSRKHNDAVTEGSSEKSIFLRESCVSLS